MKILLITDGVYPFVLGGMQKHSYSLAKHLTRKGVEVHLVHCVHQPEIPQDEWQEPTFADFDPNMITFEAFRFPKHPPLPGHYLRENKDYSKQVFERYKDRLSEFDLVYAQGFTGWKFLQASKRGQLNIPVFVNLHGYEMFQKPANFKARLEQLMLRQMARWTSVNADFVFSFGGKISTILKSLRVSPEQILEVPLGIGDQWLQDEPRPSQGVREFLFVGRYERRKGIEELTVSIQKLLSNHAGKFRFRFIGPIPEEKHIQHPDIIYHGEVREASRIKELMKNSDVLVCPSHSEGMPTVILESMASGKAILANDVGAVEQQVQENGWLLSHPDTNLLTQALEEAIHIDAKTLDNYKRRSLKMIKDRFLWDTVIDQTIESFNLGIYWYERKNVALTTKAWPAWTQPVDLQPVLHWHR